MFDKKKKKQRRLGRKCPECDGNLFFVSIETFQDGVKYSEKIIQCSECGYYENFHVSNKKQKGEPFNPKW